MQSNGKIFWASFLTLIAAGMGFAVRGDVLAEWSAFSASPKPSWARSPAAASPAWRSRSSALACLPIASATRRSCIGAFLLHVSSAGRDPGRDVCLPTAPARTPPIGACTSACSVLAGQRHVRSGHQSARRHAVSQAENALSQHPARRLAGRFDPGRIAGLLLRAAKSAVITQLRWEIPMAFFLMPDAVVRHRS